MYCAVLDALYPKSFGFNKVRWDCKNDYEFVENYKVLQQAFDKNGIKRHIEVNKLIKAKYQDNLEFCQWLKAYFEKNYNGEPYDAIARRGGKDLYYLGGAGVPPAKKVPTTTAAAPTRTGASGAGVAARKSPVPA